MDAVTAMVHGAELVIVEWFHVAVTAPLFILILLVAYYVSRGAQ